MDYDFVIVGGGSAGCVLAARLSEDPAARVCLLEAGEWPSDPDIRDPAKWPLLQGRPFDWRFETTPQAGTAGRRHPWPRGRLLGGSSCLHAMAHVRGHPADFDSWAEGGCDGWGYGDLMPYFLKSESSPLGPSPYHGATGPIRVIKPDAPHPITQVYRAAAADLGLAPTDDHDGPQMTGPSLNALAIVDGERQSLADAYLTPVTGRANLTIRTACLVDRIQLDKGGRASGVVLEADGRQETINASRAVVLSAGTLCSPGILFRSGLGPAAALRALDIPVNSDLPGLGRNLHDHLLAGSNLYRARRPVPPSNYQHSESLLYIDGSSSRPQPEIAIACVVVPVVTECFTAPPVGEAFSLMFGFCHPESRGRLTVTSRDPKAAPLIDPNYLAEAYDRNVYLDALDWAQRIGAGPALADWRDEEILPGPGVQDRADRLAFLGQAAFTHHHPVGTCKMGQDELSVVHPDLSVPGTQGLYVVDASIFPSITTGPVNAAVVAIAERAADLLLNKPVLVPHDPRLAS